MATLYEITETMRDEIEQDIVDREEPLYCDRERYIEQIITERLKDTCTPKDIPLSEYEMEDEFITDYDRRFLPKSEWQDFIDYDKAIDYIYRTYWDDLLEALDIEGDIFKGKGINISAEEVYNEMLNILDSDIYAYFDWIWDEEDEVK